ncbi:MAG: phosphatidylglycerophosphatase A [Mesorhizobium sp.]|uniref:phosphatidylglycerophosphatase A family protein n=1 Tax=Mesorhizobium sp. TaxID=1871066 RepID=UPI00120EA974|nr:phosphatidylglycerophosphatase A [Mesorhizobium sp.]TIP28847.1 MAG: phosphatidylglycerophosphatase A [Mesorhizobium sp.]
MRKFLPKLAYLLATSGGAGLSPLWPGTVGAGVGVAVAAVLIPASPWLIVLAYMGLFAVGVWASSHVVSHTRTEDPQIVVIDETFGTAATLSMLPLDPVWWAAGFLAFRFFDVAKPWPIGVVHEKVRDGLGIMLDDAAAAVFAGASLLLLNELIHRLP